MGAELTAAQLVELVELAEIEPPDANFSPRRPWGVRRSHWFGMSRRARRQHFHCCLMPLSDFVREDAEHGKRPNWWMASDEPRAAPVKDPP